MNEKAVSLRLDILKDQGDYPLAELEWTELLWLMDALIWAWERSIGDYIGVDPAVAQALRYRGPKHWDQCIADTAYEIAMRWQSKPLRANGLDSDIEPPNGIRDATAED